MQANNLMRVTSCTILTVFDSVNPNSLNSLISLHINT